MRYLVFLALLFAAPALAHDPFYYAMKLTVYEGVSYRPLSQSQAFDCKPRTFAQGNEIVMPNGARVEGYECPVRKNNYFPPLPAKHWDAR